MPHNKVGRFYCDCGMKAVLRSIRKMMLLEIRASAKVNAKKCPPGQLRMLLINYFKNVVVDNASRQSFEGCLEEDETDQLVVSIMTIFLDLEREAEFSSTVKGCSFKRSQKMKDKMQCKPEESGHSASNFVNFNKNIMDDLKENPLNIFFHDFLITRREQVLATFEMTKVRECR